ncbi:MAG: DUF262 domain-containing protein [Candidatus Abyssobacteria bacterium SURF_17]|uniref:DUF262 domain-containing protein n=1 Tax=Candidatus Abyssobacteria bacterium SURF_17 TaxID=2093361 RepID=A0A419ERV1_9BACT|nr:MAG: DUF262 domain-containing protein [Candidatus Abyssubacteria bacterium SURF_17]
MSNLTRDIGSEDLKIVDVVNLLKEDKYLIPTFQRDFVWDAQSIKKLWDSMFHFYPIGSLLYWETDSYLHTHRKLGGFEFPHDEDTVRKFKEWKYILDGQQRATSILVSMLGGKGRVEDDKDFDYTLFFDATKAEFFFPDEIETRKKAVSDERFLVRVRDVPEWKFTFYKEISSAEGFDEKIEHNLYQLQRMFTDYKLSIIRIKGVEVSEVCEIFERINQEGKKLHPVDIIVARTYRNERDGDPGFYLRDYLQGLRDVLVENGSRWQEMDDLTIIQMVAVCLRKRHTEGRNPFGITPASLDNLTTHHFEQNWESCEKTILETLKFLTDQRILGPSMMPFIYLALPLCHYFDQNKSPNRDIARQWFWRTAFALDRLSSSTEVYGLCENFFDSLEGSQEPTIPSLVLSKTKLVQASYYYRNAFSRAVLAFLANQHPKDFSDPQAEVLDNVYLLLSQAPNLHHIYPQNFLNEIDEMPADAETNSLMNICYLRARTNIRISNRNPLDYFNDFKEVRDFDGILNSHLIPAQYTKRDNFAPSDYRDFLFARAELFCNRLDQALPDVAVQIVD